MSQVDTPPEVDEAVSVDEPAEAELSPGRPVPLELPAPSHESPLVLRLCAAPWKFFVGMVCCGVLPLSVFTVGFTYRLMQRTALKAWWRRARWTYGTDVPERFADFAAADDATADHVHWPNWVLAQRPIASFAKVGDTPGLRARLRAMRRALFGSLGLNVKVGVQAIFNTWVLTLPGCTLWLFAWYAGWDNSFNKGYEQAWVGPTTGLLGVALFIAAMMYVPMAQARQAASGEWRRFYDFAVVRAVIRHRFVFCALLAAAYAALSIPVTVLKTMPMAFDREPFYPHFAEMSQAELFTALRSYFFWCAALVLPAFVLLKWVATRIYAGGVLDALRAGTLSLEDLSVYERDALFRLGVRDAAQKPRQHAVLAAAATTGRRGARFAFGTLAVALWFSFVAQIFVSEFLNYHPFVGWMNQPLVQLPWFDYIPRALRP